VIALVAGSILALIGVLLVLGGAALLLVHAFARDSDGYYTSGTERLSTPTRALTVEDVDLGDEPADLVPKDILGRVRIRVERPDGRPVFVGIAHQDDVDRYLSGVGHAEVEDLSPAEYKVTSGGAPRRRPGAESFWVARGQGPGRQTADWEVEGGHWAAVAMNVDGSRRVVVDADVAAKVGWFVAAGIGMLVVGLLMLAGGVAVIVLAARRARRV
jgi:hypothetical protein